MGVADGEIEIPADEVGDSPAEPLTVEPFLSLADLDEDIGGGGASALIDCQQQLDELVPKLGRHARHHADIDQGQTVVRSDENVPGMGIGMEEAVYQNLIQVGSKQLDREIVAIELEATEWSERTSVAALDPVHGEDQRRGVIRNRLRNDDSLVARQVVVKQGQVSRLAPVVQLGQQRPAELNCHRLEAEAPARRGVIGRRTPRSRRSPPYPPRSGCGCRGVAP